jgi:hypothetical protein
MRGSAQAYGAYPTVGLTVLQRFNLVLTTLRDGPQTTGDLDQIARYVEAIDPRVNAVVLGNEIGHRLLHSHLWLRPTLSIAMKRIGARTLLPGRILTSKSLMKSGEYIRLADAGFPVPRWASITPDTVLDPDDWGPYVVEKPNFGALGAYVRIKRTGRVKYKHPDQLESTHYGRRGGLLVQEFIYTGKWPQSFRVTTLLGKVILCYHQVTVGRGNPLSGRWNHGKDGGPSIVSNTKEMKVTPVRDDDVIALSEKAHRAAFPDIPLLGFDVIRDADSGKLYILECHAHGPTWPFSSDTAQGIQEANRVDFVSQFDAFKTCAAILAEATPRLAARRLPFQSIGENWT